jgi:hypothetical protein
LKKATFLVAMALAILALSASAHAAISFGTGTPNSISTTLSPLFANLVNFDDKATDTAVLSNDYVANGILSITELEGLGTLARYAGSQSLPNYVGTGDNGERGNDAVAGGWDGTILIQFANFVPAGGIGIAGIGVQTIDLLDINGNILGTEVAPSGLNVYVTFSDSLSQTVALRIRGDFFAIDDLQWNKGAPVPLPPTMLLLGSGLLGLVGWRRFRKS